MAKDHTNPLAVTMPYEFPSANDYPTEVLATRFQAWRSIIKDIVNYLKEYSSVQEEIVRQQIRLQQAVGISSKSVATNHSDNHINNRHSSNYKEVDVAEINRLFLPIGNGSIQDLPTILTQFHQQNVTNSQKTLKDLSGTIIPKFEELRKDLLVKIKEIKNLQNDFKNNLGKEVVETKNLISQYYQAVELSNKLDHGHQVNESSTNDVSKYDPYLVKLKLDRQLKRQLQEENYLYQAYENLQQAGGKLESIIVIELQTFLSQFLRLLNEEHSTIPNFLLPNLQNGFLAKESTFEWDSFIAKNTSTSGTNALGNTTSLKNGTFIDLNFRPRKFSDLIINNYNLALNVPVREGVLERRSKFLKNYSSGWYVLTCNFIHEFKTNDRKKEQIPILSIPLDSCQVSEHSKDDGKTGGTYKFILTSKLSNGLMHRNQNWVFRADTYQKMIGWYDDIKNLTNLATPSARARHINKTMKLDTHLNPNLVINRLSRTSTTVSELSNKNTLKTVETANSKRTKTTTGQTRLSSTFSSKNNNNSPRLNHLINSDGTIVTPVDSNDVNPQSQVHSMQSPKPPSLVPNGTQAPLQMLPPNFVQGYYINANGQQIQQFYDPVQQQYFTISAQPQPQPQPPGPQPQYFPSSPPPQQFQASSPPPQQGYFSTSPPSQPLSQTQSFYYMGQMQPLQSQEHTFGGQLPYPTDNIRTPLNESHEKPDLQPRDEVTPEKTLAETLKNDDDDDNETNEINKSISKVSV